MLRFLIGCKLASCMALCHGCGRTHRLSTYAFAAITCKEVVIFGQSDIMKSSHAHSSMRDVLRCKSSLAASLSLPLSLARRFCKEKELSQGRCRSPCVQVVQPVSPNSSKLGGLVVLQRAIRLRSCSDKFLANFVFVVELKPSPRLSVGLLLYFRFTLPRIPAGYMPM